MCRYQSNTTRDVFDTIMSIQPKDSATSGGETRESIVWRMAKEMLEKMPSGYVPYEVECLPSLHEISN